MRNNPPHPDSSINTAKEKQMKILYTAFKGTRNTSFQLVSTAGKDALFLTNSFSGLCKDIASVSEHFDAVIMFGVDKKLSNQIRVETCAEYHGEFLCTDFNIAELERNCAEQLTPYTVSHHPIAYLCNAAYYHMLKKIPSTVFVHIPSAKGMSDSFMQKLKDALIE